MHSDSKKRHSFLALLFAAGDLQRSVVKNVESNPAGINIMVKQKLNHEQLKDIIQKNRIEMLEKGISRASVKHIITNGEMIENYPEKYLLSRLIGRMRKTLKVILRPGGINEPNQRYLSTLRWA